ncbi:MAG: prolipoprotein diacylglyceryl transferase [Bacteroidetes bacterium]|nr:prolipoprotein diacylglyceryl transferase [Bacteroidota bacterium]
MNLVINWEVTPELFENMKTPNLYGLLFVTGLIAGYFIVKNMFKREDIKEEFLDKLVFYIVLSTIIGARLGHVLFYGPYFDVINENGFIERGYFSHPIDILKVWEGGLASHGATLMILIALYFYSKKVIQKPYLWILDRIAVAATITACFIRLGNLVNSEIVGIPTDLPWAFSFTHFYNEELGMYDATPRHPAQLYEAICYLFTFGFLSFLYYKKKAYEHAGKLFGWFMVLTWGARFMVEFIKIGQTDRDFTWALNTGQMLSIPLIGVGIYFLIRKKPALKVE